MSTLVEPLLASGYGLFLVLASNLWLAWVSRSTAAGGAWPHSEADRFHRAMALVVHIVALVLLGAALLRHWVLDAAAIVALPMALVAWGLGRHFKALAHRVA